MLQNRHDIIHQKGQRRWKGDGKAMSWGQVIAAGANPWVSKLQPSGMPGASLQVPLHFSPIFSLFFGFLPGCPPDLARASYVGSSKPRLLDCEMGWMVMVRCKSWRLMCPTGSSEVGGKEITSPRLGAFLQDFQGMRLILLYNPFHCDFLALLQRFVFQSSCIHISEYLEPRCRTCGRKTSEQRKRWGRCVHGSSGEHHGLHWCGPHGVPVCGAGPLLATAP